MEEQIKQEILQQYIDGKSILQLSKEYPFSYRKIQKLIVDNNIPIRGGRKKKTLSIEQLIQLKDLYENGIEYKDLEIIFSLNRETIRNIVNENNFQRKNNNRVNKRIKSDYFSIIDSAEKAYWLGFLYTDGSVDHYRKTGRIRLQLQNSDIEILEKFKEDLQLDCQIIHDKRSNHQCSSIEFIDEQIFNDLAKFGIIPNKTYLSEHLMYQEIPKQFLNSYILGLFDGDGCLTYSQDFATDVTFSFTTYSKTIALDFQLLIDELIDKKEHSQLIYTNAWHVQWRGRKQVLKILDLLYQNSPRYLKRKYKKYKLLKQSLE